MAAVPSKPASKPIGCKHRRLPPRPGVPRTAERGSRGGRCVPPLLSPASGKSTGSAGDARRREPHRDDLRDTRLSIPPARRSRGSANDPRSRPATPASVQLGYGRRLLRLAAPRLERTPNLWILLRERRPLRRSGTYFPVTSRDRRDRARRPDALALRSSSPHLSFPPEPSATVEARAPLRPGRPRDQPASGATTPAGDGRHWRDGIPEPHGRTRPYLPLRLAFTTGVASAGIGCSLPRSIEGRGRAPRRSATRSSCRPTFRAAK